MVFRTTKMATSCAIYLLEKNELSEQEISNIVSLCQQEAKVSLQKQAILFQ